MKKEIREVDEKRGIVQITIADERWYMRSQENPITKVPEWKAVPSVTWIAGHYPKGIPFYKWLAEKGWDEAESIKHAAGDKGSKVHAAISMILRGEEMRIDTKIVNPRTEQEEDLTYEEIECIKSFVDWRASLESFVPVAWDIAVFSDKHNYAGSIDLIAYVNGELYIIDFKTSQYIWREYELQTSAYRETLANGENEILFNGKAVDFSNALIGILQVGYRKNKNFYKWNEIDNAFDLFLVAQEIWKREAGSQEVKKRDYPIVLSPAIKAADVNVEEHTVEVSSLELKNRAKRSK